MNYKKRFGKSGEEIAARLIQKKGYKLISKNYQTRFGEIDLIAIDKDRLVLIEVKTRINEKFGKPEEAVGKRKLERIKKAGMQFIAENKNLPKKIMVEVVALQISSGIVKSAKLIKVI